MAKKKKHKSKLDLKSLRRNKQVKRFWPAILLLIGIIIGLSLAWLQPPDVHPKSLIWAADKTVTVPNGLAASLQQRNDCQNYKSKDGSPGVNLWSVYQTSKNKFAKVAYGCSTKLNLYLMAVREGDKWLVIPPEEYFASRVQPAGAISSFLPKCSYIDTYKIDKSIEPFCLETDGTARENKLP